MTDLLVPVGAVVDLGDVLAEPALTRDHQVVECYTQLPVTRLLQHGYTVAPSFTPGIEEVWRQKQIQRSSRLFGG